MATVQVIQQGDGTYIVLVDGVAFPAATAADALSVRRRYERPTAIEDWERIGRPILAQFEHLIDAIGEPERLYTATEISQQISDAAPGAFVGASSLTRERALEWAECFSVFRAFLETPMAISQRTPLQVVTTRD